MKNYKIIEDYLDELIPDPKCELNYFNDYSLLIAIMLSAQTTDKRVNEVTKVLFNKYNSLDKLSKADIKDLENIIHPLGSFRKKAYNLREIARIIHEEYNDSVPKERELLERLPGVGRKTVNVFYAEYLNVPAIAVDTHVERVTKRLKLAKESDDVVVIEKKLMKNIKKENWGKRHLQFVLFGRYFCKAKKPECSSCKLKDICKVH
jgi:endonuclease-3